MAQPRIDPARVLAALGDPTRRKIVESLGERPQSVSHLAAPLGVTVTAIGQHLQVLADCGLVSTEKIGRVRICRLERAGLASLQQWIDDRRSAWEVRLDQLGDLLDEMGD
jgi:DNA-binding transcriptional ArsR family regulator